MKIHPITTCAALAITLLLATTGCGAPQATNTPAEAPADAGGAANVEVTPPPSEEPAEPETTPETQADAAPEPSPETDAAAGEALPPVQEADTAAIAALMKETLGKVTVVNIWATWCPPCVHETPDLVTFYNETDRDQVAFVSISADDVAEIDGEIPKFQRNLDISFPIHVLNERDQEGLDAALRTPFEGALPTTIIYDRQGNAIDTVMGAITLDELRAKVTPLLGAP